MRLTFRGGWWLARFGHIASGWVMLRRDPVDPTLFRPGFSGRTSSTASRPHWATDFFMSEPDLVPMSQASVVVRQITQQRGVAWHWSPAEDGGVYLYRFLESIPWAHITAAEIQARQQRTA